MYPVLMAAASGTDYQTVIEALQTSFSESSLASILAYGVGAVAGMVFFWFAVKYVGRMFLRAFKRGKIRL